MSGLLLKKHITYQNKWFFVLLKMLDFNYKSFIRFILISDASSKLVVGSVWTVISTGTERND